MFTGKLTNRLFINIAVAFTLLMGNAFFPIKVQALGNTITVETSSDDTLDNSLCSLREAIDNANTEGSGNGDCEAGTSDDSIVFADGISAIVIGSTLPTITDPDGLTINGGGDVTIDGSDTYRILMVDNSGSLTLENLTIEDGACTSCLGGGIYSGGALIANNTTFNSNQQGIYSYEGSITISGSVFIGNSSTYGGAVNCSGTSCSLTISNSVFTGNSSPSGGGAAIYSGGTMSVTSSSFVNNTGTAGGAGSIFVDGGGQATITKSTFSGTIGASTRAIYNNSSTLTIANSTFYGNIATDYGGGVSNVSGTLTIKNSTFSGNKAPSGGADIYQYGTGATLNLTNSILANDEGGGDCVLASGTITATNNLIEDASNACGLLNGVDGNIVGSDPNLGAAMGSPAYLPLNAGSPALNVGDDAVCASAPVDNLSQNGLTRPQGSHCDIGSFEKMFILKTTLRSTDAPDGWVLESTEISGVGGSKNNTDTTIRLGDDAADKQYRAILSFDTSSVPNNAVITKATLKIRKQGLIGTNPFTILGGLRVDMSKPSFGALTLANADFEAAAGKVGVATFGTTPVLNWYSAVLNLTGRNYINKLGNTQFRLRFFTDDNNDNGADFMKFYSGDYATVSARPTLIVEYYLP